MPFGPCQASFKNARFYPRPATISADTGEELTQPAGAGGSPNGNTIIRPANPFRTYLTLKNLATIAGENIRYGYEDRLTLVADGFQLAPQQAVDIESPQEIYTVSETAGAIATNWDEGIG